MRTKKLSVVPTGLDKLIQYNDFIQDERLILYLLDSEKNDVTVKIHPACQKTITNEMKRKGDTVLTTSKKKKLPSTTMRCDSCDSFPAESSAGKLIVSIPDLRVFQILNIVNVKKSETFVHCLSGIVFQTECTENL